MYKLNLSVAITIHCFGFIMFCIILIFPGINSLKFMRCNNWNVIWEVYCNTSYERFLKSYSIVCVIYNNYLTNEIIVYSLNTVNVS